MSQQNPFQLILHTYETIANSIGNHLSHFVKPPNPISIFHLQPPLGQPPLPSPSRAIRTATQDGSTGGVAAESGEPVATSSSASKVKAAVPLTKAELGRATWTLLHAVAAQYPDHPTRQQKRDVKELMAIISRLYPCKDCQAHFKEILKVNPVMAGSHDEFSLWLCHVHNTVNRSIGKPTFPCQRVDGRWGRLDCPERVCDVEGGTDVP